MHYFETCKQDCIPINAHSKGSVTKLLELVEFKLKEAISKEPTLLVMVVGVPNVGKSALINSVHQIARSRFPGKKELLPNNLIDYWNLESLLLLLLALVADVRFGSIS